MPAQLGEGQTGTAFWPREPIHKAGGLPKKANQSEQVALVSPVDSCYGEWRVAKRDARVIASPVYVDRTLEQKR